MVSRFWRQHGVARQGRREARYAGISGRPRTPHGGLVLRQKRTDYCRVGHLVHDLEHDALAAPSCRCADELTERPRDPALPSDHLADIVLGDEEPQYDDVVALLALDANSGRIVDEPPRELLQ